MPTAIARRRFLRTAGSAAVLTGASLAWPRPARAQAGPITIGVLAPLTGVFATYGRDIVDGAQLYADEVGGQMGARKVQLVVEDYQVKPDVAVDRKSVV